MKAVITTVFLLLTIQANSQSFGLSSDTNLLTYEEVIKVDGMSSEELFNKVKEWTIETFNNAEKVIVGENKPSLIKARFIQAYFNGLGKNADYYNTLTVRVKDGAVKITIDQMVMSSGYGVEQTIFKKDGSKRKGQIYQKIHDDIESKCRDLVKNLANYMNKDPEW
ncbi:DUF4468 domain-containing protein [Fulvivirga maritima]|uniref:DUF4468 domain-containing protein n=1 Tax=Fulvivirga maritima TaxID=2904247 RepID=UPI001F3FFA96|nr:DUF4468 domain-containing protein [Fulvivirga maritima]UII26386.1 DUF4468 domain-containing protein [Fulvivirga maritima]